MDETLVELRVEGEPEPWSRAGYRQYKGKLIIYDPQITEKRLVKCQLSAQFDREPLQCPVRVELVFAMQIPKSYSAKEREAALTGKTKFAKKPDVDNLQKYIFDCCNGQIFSDDALVYEVHAQKVYSSTPHTQIKLFFCECADHESV